MGRYAFQRDLKFIYSAMAPAIHEGSAIVTGQDNTTVFYNPVQEFNRDMSIAILSKFGEVFADPLIIYEGLSATGLRSVRYAKEVEKVKAIYANDFDKAAFECISNNVKSNDVSETVIPFLGDANVNMSKASEIFAPMFAYSFSNYK